MEYKIVIPFGKYKGQSLGYIKDRDPSYLRWISSSSSMIPKWKEAAHRVLNNKSLDDMNLDSYMTETETIYKDISITKGSKDKVEVKFHPSKNLVERFKYEIDGRTWNKESKVWEVPKTQILMLLKLFKDSKTINMDSYVEKLIKEEYNRKKDLNVLRSKEDIDFDPNTKIPLYPYQKVAVKFAERASGRVLIGDQMGVGKTATGIGYATYNNFKTLVVCPKSVIANWRREIERFAGKKTTTWSSSDGKIGRIDSQFHVINYDAVEKHIKDLNKAGFDLLICDEATYLKNRKTKRAKSVLGYWNERKKYPGIKTKHVLFLTGTPVLNNPTEAFHLLSFLDKNRFNNFTHFVERYGGWRGELPKNLDELHERTKDLVIRRSLREVQPELPEKQRNEVYVELTKKERQEYNKYLDELFKKWKFEGKPSVQHLPKLQNFLFEMKKERLIEMVDEFMSNDHGVLLFSVYKNPLYQLKEHYGDKAVLLTGDITDTDERQDLIDKLSSGEAKIGLFTIGVGSMGIDKIQKEISTVIFLNMWFVPAIHEQAEGRVYRTGQKHKVQVYYLMCEDTIDEYMREILSEKQKLIDQIVDGKIVNYNPDKSFFKEFIQMINVQFQENFKETSSLDYEPGTD